MPHTQDECATEVEIVVDEEANARIDEQNKNWDYAREVSRQARADPISPYAGKYLGIVHQQVVAVADTPDELHEKFDALGLSPGERIVIDASADHDHTIMFWSPTFFTVGEAQVRGSE
jgi:hypothetical protein